MNKFLSVIFILLCFVTALQAPGCNFSKNLPDNSRQLAGKQKAQAENWLYNANLLYNVRDYEFAREYYEKILTYYPGTKYAFEARSKMKAIDNLKK